MNEVLINQIRERIKNGEFTSIEALDNYLKLRNSQLELTNNGEVLKPEEYEKLFNELKDYYELNYEKLKTLNMDDVTEFEVNDKKFVKSGTYDEGSTIMNNEDSEKNIVQEFSDRQGELISAQTENSEENRDAIVDSMEQEKETINLQNVSDIKQEDLTLEQRAEFQKVLSTLDTERLGVKADPVHNIYQTSEGDIYYASKNSRGELEVKRAVENDVVTDKKEVKVVGDDGLEMDQTIEVPDETTLDNQFMSEEWDYDKLEAARKQIESGEFIQNREELLRQIEEAKMAKASQGLTDVEKRQLQIEQRQKVLLKKKELPTSKAGFESIVLECFVLAVISISILIILFVK